MLDLINFLLSISMYCRMSGICMHKTGKIFELISYKLNIVKDDIYRVSHHFLPLTSFEIIKMTLKSRKKLTQS